MCVWQVYVYAKMYLHPMIWQQLLIIMATTQSSRHPSILLPCYIHVYPSEVYSHTRSTTPRLTGLWVAKWPETGGSFMTAESYKAFCFVCKGVARQWKEQRKGRNAAYVCARHPNNNPNVNMAIWVVYMYILHCCCIPHLAHYVEHCKCTHSSILCELVWHAKYTEPEVSLNACIGSWRHNYAALFNIWAGTTLQC